MKLKPSTYAETLRKSLGFDRALFVSESRMRDTASSNWNNIPNSTVYNYNDKRKANALDVSRLAALNGFWTEVHHVIKKRNRAGK